MKKATKIIALLLCAVLLVGASVAGTVAYLTSKDDVTNTFTVGKVEIKLEEKALDVKTGKQQTGGTPVTELQDIKLIPGRTIEKEPFITVGDDSEACWLFVKVENGLAGAGTITWAADWTQIGTTNYWKYGKTVAAKEVVTVFTEFVCNEKLGNDALKAFDGKEIVITAYAIQSEGVSADAAWTSLSTQLNLT